MKKILFFVGLFLFPLIVVNANEIYNIDMDIYVDNNGVATITETWDAKVEEGTEGWHPYYELGSSTIQVLEAKMDDKEYKIVDEWDENSGFNSKKYKAGLYYPSSKETDICFGISEYGRHSYSIKYSITNFVSSVNDADIIYWQLFPYGFSAQPESVHVKIYSDFKYENGLDVWGYGNYGGTAYVYDGYIEMNSDGKLDEDEYMVVLVKFPSGTFKTKNKVDNDFNYYFNKAEEGATHYVDKKNTKSDLSIIFDYLFKVFFFVFWPFLFIVIGKKANKDKYDFGQIGNRVKKDIPNFRDIPCNKDIYRAYFVAEKYNINKKKTDLLGAVLLKWLKTGNVKVEKVNKKVLFKEKTESNIIFVTVPETIELEIKLYNWMLEASKDGKLESGEFKRWCSNNYSQIIKWFDDVIDYERDLLIDEGKITEQEKGSSLFKTKSYIVDPSLMLEAEQLQGLKNFFKEFTVIEEREPIEVSLWDEYLMYAQIFGIADEVAKQFKKLYPEITENMNNLGYDYDDIVFLYIISNTGISSATAAQSRASSYSAGGGGFSSGGGGGGSFGGGGGGGGFR